MDEHVSLESFTGESYKEKYNNLTHEEKIGFSLALVLISHIIKDGKVCEFTPEELEKWKIILHGMGLAMGFETTN